MPIIEFPVELVLELADDGDLKPIAVAVDWLFFNLPMAVLFSSAPSTPVSDVNDVTDLTEEDLVTKDCVELDSELVAPHDVFVEGVLPRRTCNTRPPGVDVNVDCRLSIIIKRITE